MAPLLAIVVPMFNRAALVGRAIKACMAQTHKDFDLIVVDDGSVDGSAAIVEEFCALDERIRLVRHDCNRGVSAARRTGVENTRAEWILFADSDDELLPCALEVCARRISMVAPEVGRIALMYELSEGGFSPEPALVPSVWNYEGYLRWTAQVAKRSDFVNCIKRSTFSVVPFSDDRSLEALYHHDFAKVFSTACFADVVARVHSDATNRTINWTTADLLRMAPDNATARARLVAQHGQALLAVAPDRYDAELRVTSLYCLLAGRRTDALKFAVPYLSRRFGVDFIVACVAGLLDRRILAHMTLAWGRLRRRVRGRP